VAAAFRADPDAAIDGLPHPLLVDEWQLVPESLGAIKRAIDNGASAGSFLVTGSVRSSIDADHWPGTGRLTRVRLFPLSEREKLGRGGRAGFINQLEAESLALSSVPDSTLSVSDYLERALGGGYPEAFKVSSTAVSARWYSSYIDDTVTRDVNGLAGSVTRPRDAQRLRAWLEAVAINSAGSPTSAALCRATGINQRTAEAYDGLLEDLFITQRVPAWSTNRLKRLARAPKRYVIDCGVWGAAVGASPKSLKLDGDLTGRLLDTFVAAQIRPELEATGGRMFHLRTLEGRHEVDIVLELRSGGLVGIEVKASAGPRPADSRHLAWLRDQIGDEFRVGIVFHTGPRAYRLDDRIMAIPISSLWTT
jgi:predicted AAA+ superfamily ATPase